MKKIDNKILKNLKPFANLSIDKINDIADKAILEELPAGRVLFRQGDHDKRTYFLFAGQIELSTTNNSRPKILKAKSTAANSAIEQTLPRQVTARTKTAATLLSIDTTLLDILTADESALSYEVTEIDVNEGDDSGDWMLRFLQSKAFLNLPTANIQRLLMSLEEVDYNKAQVVVKQGEQDDYYYIIKSGKCNVSRRPAPQVKDVNLAILGIGDGFGEEALITNGKRNASVTMSENGTLMRLKKEDFNELLVQPLLDYVDEVTATQQIKSGARLIDVRGKQEFNKDAIDGAINIPLSMLRNRISSLNPSRRYVVYCDSGNRSAAAAFLMCQLGLQCSIIKAGLNSCEIQLRPKPKTANKAQPAAAVTQNNNPPTSVITKKTASTANNNDDLIPTVSLTLDEENAIKAKAEKDFSEKLKVERDRALKTVEQQFKSKLKVEQNKTHQAEHDIKNARQEVDRIKKEALAIREHSQLELERHKAEIVKERERVEKELQRAKLEADQKAVAEQELLAKQKLAEQDVLNAQQKAHNIQQDSEYEIEQLRNELTQHKLEQQALEKQRLAAEKEALKAKKLAESARNEANNEINSIRSKVQQEKVELQKAIEEHQKLTEEQLQKNAETADQARRDAENAVTQLRAELEEKNKQNQHLEQQQQHAEKIAHDMTIEAKEARLAAEMEATIFRSEAESIREEALQEAQHMREEMETARRLLEQQANITQAENEQARLSRQQAEEELLFQEKEQALQQTKLQAAAQARKLELEQEAQQHATEARRAKAKAEAQKQAEIEALLEAEQEAAAIAAEEAAARRAKAEAQALEQARLEAEQSAIRLAEEHRRKVAATERELLAKKRAAEIAAKLQSRNSALNQQSSEDSMQSGISLAKSSLTEKNGRITLEGEHDIFIFQRPNDERYQQADSDENIPELIPELNAIDDQFDFGDTSDTPADDPSTSKNDVIFLQETHFEATPVFTQQPSASTASRTVNPTNSVALSSNAFLQSSVSTTTGNYQAPFRTKKRRHRSLIAIAASILVITTIGIFSATNETYLNIDKVLAWLEPDQQVVVEEPETRRLARIAAAQSRAELSVKEAADSEFEKMLEKWKDSVELGSNDGE